MVRQGSRKDAHSAERWIKFSPVLESIKTKPPVTVAENKKKTKKGMERDRERGGDDDVILCGSRCCCPSAI